TEVNLAQLFRKRSATYGKATRWRQKVGDKWLKMTWRENQELVNSVIAGLDAIGARPGEVVGILSGTRWEWMAADWGIIGLGAVCVTIYPSNLAPLVAFIVNDSEAHFLFAENQAQYRKLLSIREHFPNVRKVILFQDAERFAADPWVMSFEDLRRASARSPREADAFAAERAAAIRPDDRLTLVYTSGTTG